MFTKPKRRTGHQVEAGAMADIAFLLLIFFLVTTTIIQESGLQVRLPAYLPASVQPLPDRNVLSVKINAGNQLLVEQEVLPFEQLEVKVREFIQNPNQLPHLPSSPRHAVVALQHDRGTSYDAYLTVYDQLLMGYRSIWEAEARKLYGQAYEQLGKAEQRSIRSAWPMVISESEPVEF
jgi:biopolymer transport protein ExbD